MGTATSLKLHGIFRQHFGEPEIVVRSPGRINLIGEHTDYNDGFVMPAAIDLSVYIAVKKRSDNELHWIAADLNQSYIGQIDSYTSDTRGWPNYWLGAIQQLKKIGQPIGGFNAVISADLPVGAGLSSSAALTCGILFALNQIFDCQLTQLQIIQMAQATEHEFIGLQCGIMDQFACMMGKENQVLLLDCQSLEFSYAPFQFPGLELVLLDTGVKHSLADSAYNRRRQSCREGVELIRKNYPAANSLREVTEEMILHSIPMNHEARQRCLYVVQENERVLQSANQLQEGDWRGFGKNMFATHAGLRDLYEVSCNEADYLVALAEKTEFIPGARMMGGGFGGCVLLLIPILQSKPWVQQAEKEFLTHFGIRLKNYPVTISPGCSIL